MPTRSHRRSRRAPPGLRTHPTPLAGLPDPPSQADAKRPTPNPFEHAERAYAGTSPRPHLVSMNCFDNSHDHRGRGCPTSTPPTNLPAQVRRATLGHTYPHLVTKPSASADAQLVPSCSPAVFSPVLPTSPKGCPRHN